MFLNPLIWITGLSGSGKSTIARLMYKELKEKYKTTAIIIDGDELRVVLGESKSYKDNERLKLAYIYARLGKLLSDQGITVVVATISMFDEVRAWNRDNLKEYIEVYLKVPSHELKKRDPKGLYSSTKENEMVGIGASFEAPKNPDLVFDFSYEKITPETIVNAIINFMKKGMQNENGMELFITG